MTKEFQNIICISWTTLLLITTPASGQTFPFHRVDIYTAAGPQGVAVGDFNSDGISDIAVLNSSASSVSILLGKGDGTFQDPKTTMGTTAPTTFALADFNLDGKLDLIMSDQDNNRTFIMLGKGDGTFQAPISWAIGFEAGIAVGDFNGDSRPDVALTDFGQGIVYVALGNGDGTFSTPVPNTVGTGLGSGTTQVVVFDLDGDGKMDIVAGNLFANTVSVLLGKGDGTFQPSVSYPTNGQNSPCLAVGDISGDGKPDLVVCQGGGVGVLLGNGNGTFQSVHSYSLAPHTLGVAIGDINGDGKPDVIAVAGKFSATNDGVWVLPGNGDGTFGTALSFALGGNPDALALADFNRDHELDVVVANQFTNGVSVLLNLQPAALVPVTFNSVPSGLQVTIGNGAPCSTPCIVNLYAGTNHTIAVESPQYQSGALAFMSWSDSGAQSHQILVPSAPAVYTATFKMQFQLTTGDLPANGGTITPPSGGYYDAGAVVTVQAIPASGYYFANWSGPVASTSQSTTSVTMDASKSITAFFNPVTSQTDGLLFVPLRPCRIADTRNPTGAFGGPRLASHEIRSIPVGSSLCGIPPTAAAYALNVTVVPNGPLAYLTLWPAGQTQPLVSTLNSLDGRVKANAAIVPAGNGGAVNVFVTDQADVVLDIDGYFVPAGDAANLAFYPVIPCRIADTRSATGPFGGPTISAGESRTFLPGQSVCNIPPTARAYSLNFTAVPKNSLSFLTTWPSGQDQPFVSTLNSLTGEIVANAAIVPAGTNGGVSVYVTDTSDVIIDVNGYFAPTGAPGALSFYTISPCRLLDTRSPSATLGGPRMSAGQTRTLPLLSSGCGVSNSAQAYSINATVVPLVDLSFLTLWPSGQFQPLVSTLNALDGEITSNAAIVPANSGGVINAYATDVTDLILDISGYFAP